jgi:hypothetical protein
MTSFSDLTSCDSLSQIGLAQRVTPCNFQEGQTTTCHECSYLVLHIVYLERISPLSM